MGRPTKHQQRYKNVWRKTVMTEEVVRKLEEWFSYGFSDVEACQYAWVSRTSLHEYIKKNPEFSNRKAELKENIKMHVKKNIWDAIREKKDLETSKWYAKHAMKEFNPTQQVEQTNKNINIDLSELENKTPKELEELRQQIINS